ncbi:hypothetical protein EON67_05185 [archaeon]|nr:MAG: hypothetical protein EON67_05185 [archaeon]
MRRSHAMASLFGDASLWDDSSIFASELFKPSPIAVLLGGSTRPPLAALLREDGIIQETQAQSEALLT